MFRKHNSHIYFWVFLLLFWERKHHNFLNNDNRFLPTCSMIFFFFFYLISCYHKIIPSIIAGILQYNIKYLKYLGLAW